MAKFSTLLTLLLSFLLADAQQNFMDPEFKAHLYDHDLEDPSSMSFSRSEFALDYNIHHLRLEITANPPQRAIEGVCVLTSTVIKNNLDTLKFDFVDDTTYRIDSVNVNGIAYTNFIRNNDKILIPLQSSLGSGTAVTSYISYAGSPSSGPHFRFFYSGYRLGSASFWTMSEPYGSKHWWPSKMDLIDKIDSCDIYLNSPDTLRGVSNGMLISENTANGRTVSHWKHNYPINNYLVAVAIGDYWVKNSTLNYSGKTLPMVDYLYKRDSSWYDTSTATINQTFALFDSLFGDYPFENERYGHAQFSRGGGMEHQTISFMQDLNQPLVAHELAHQWFGNKVTCGSWQDLWLNEGFATYLTALTYEAGFGDMDWMTWKQNTINLVGRKFGRVWREDTVNTASLFSPTYTYNKGAIALHAIRWQIGDQAFFQGVRNFLNDPRLAYGFARTDDLKMHLEATSQQDLDGLFADWIYGYNCPGYTLTWRVNANMIVMKMDQAINFPSDSVVEMNVPIALYRNGVREDIIFPFDKNGMQMSRSIGYLPDSVVIDPDLWICYSTKSVLEGIHENVSLNEADGLENLIIYPNPTNDVLNISAPSFIQEETIVRILNSIGETVYETTWLKGESNFSADVSSLEAGMYLLLLESESKASVHRVAIN